MIKNIIFDFGAVFINLDKHGAMQNALQLFELDEFPEDLNAINCLYEEGLISTEEFLEFYQDNFPKLSKENIIEAWNHILVDFPIHRLEFIQKLASNKDHKLFLLSNTNELHIKWVQEHIPFYEEFKSCFDAFYLSHEINLRKPNAAIYEFVLNENNLKSEETLFIDDVEANTKSASQLGIHTWNIDESSEDVVDLFHIKNRIF
jgi:putative hydrolase of the HAD superfamily